MEISTIFSDFATGAAAVADVVGDNRAEIARFDRIMSRSFKLKRNGDMDLLGSDGQVVTSRRARAQLFSHTSMADLDGDGVLEMVTLREDRAESRIRVNAVTTQRRRVRLRTKRFAKKKTLTLSSGQVSYADVDRDGHVEAWTYTNSVPPLSDPEIDFTGYMVPYQDRGTPTPVKAMSHRLFFSAMWPGGIAIGDIDGNGQQEVVAGMLGDGCGLTECQFSVPDDDYHKLRQGVVAQGIDGTMLPAFPKPLPQCAGSTENFVNCPQLCCGWVDDPRYGAPAIADLDGDGLKEVLWVDPELRRLFVWNVAGTPGPLLADWPMYHGNPKHSNVYQPGP